jgi:hypothetical protein
MNEIYQKPMITGYLLRKKNGEELSLTGDAVNRMLEAGEILSDWVLYEEVEFSGKSAHRREIPSNRWFESGGLLLWYRNCADVKNAYIDLTKKADEHQPPVSISLELSEIDGGEMHHCVAIRTFSIFEWLADHWLATLNVQPVEEEIEQGPAVFNYYSQHAKIEKKVRIDV